MRLEQFEKKLVHCTSRAIADFNMIENGDRVLVCLSGGKDSFTMLFMLRLIQAQRKKLFSIHVFTLQQKFSPWDNTEFKNFLEAYNIPYTILTRDIQSIINKKCGPKKSHCSLCSRLRRGNIYNFAKEHGYNKIALGHHRDDLIQTLLMSICYSGAIRSMPPKLLTDDKRHVVIRPLAYCQEKDIIQYAKLKQFPIVTCNMYCTRQGKKRNYIADIIADLAKDNPKVPSNMLHSLKNVNSSQLMDQNIWDFKNLRANDFADIS